MKPEKSKTGIIIKKPWPDRIENIHPHKMINYLIISVFSILYVFLSFLFIKYLVFEIGGNFSYDLPKFFTLSTLLLTVTGIFTSRLLTAYKNDEIRVLRKQLGYLLISGLLFFISQSFACMELINNNLLNVNDKISTYLAVFTGAHLSIVFAGLIMTAMLFYKYVLVENDPVKTLIAVTNPMEKIRLEIFTTFWHFNMFSWAMIFLMLLFVF